MSCGKSRWLVPLIQRSNAILFRVAWVARRIERVQVGGNVLEIDDSRVWVSASQDPGGRRGQKHVVALIELAAPDVGHVEAAGSADDPAEDDAAVGGHLPRPGILPDKVLPQQGAGAQQLDELGEGVHWRRLLADAL
jgi:hypothetical protein